MPKFKHPDPEVQQQVKITLQAIGRLLHKLRVDRKESLKNVGKAIKMSPVLISKTEKGEYNFWLTQLHRLAQHYETTVYDIFNQAENETNHPSTK